MKTISETTINKVFKYGTHKQLENSVNRWLKNGVATETKGDNMKIIVKHIPKNTKFLIDKNGIFGWTSTTLNIW